ncbi:60S ribosomal protein L11 [Blastocystis sp. subtype 4]|uniref:60S ribosomal protein L11 n=1 Tax=Blastocystis sp. subtype 4 TaxID=944170 RepID=UPI0007115327|nr:60S ribosomal protein L11 [Blastocystis sp. subtype 4]KNB41283.1 60S ribosomal protein L11 [Blastocystis sp. subtype 4]|eukprot:XP_014524726.1 60S ribosomal protein L11 [Blastocystis sp. subtype 4]
MKRGDIFRIILWLVKEDTAEYYVLGVCRFIQIPSLFYQNNKYFISQLLWYVLVSEKANVMRNIRVEKLVINICVGESGDAVSKAARVLQQITGQEPVYGKGMRFAD